MNLKKLNEELKILLNEFALPRSKVKDEVISLSKPIFRHLIKLLLDSDNISVEHWTEELLTFLKECIDSKIKGANRYPNEKELINWLTERYSDYDSLRSVLFYLDKEINEEQMKELYNKITTILNKAVSFLCDFSLNKDKLRQIIFNESNI